MVITPPTGRFNVSTDCIRRELSVSQNDGRNKFDLHRGVVGHVSRWHFSWTGRQVQLVWQQRQPVVIIHQGVSVFREKMEARLTIDATTSTCEASTPSFHF